jgi:hypothetical protein
VVEDGIRQEFSLTYLKLSVIETVKGSLPISGRHWLLTYLTLDAPVVHRLFTQFATISLHAEEISESGGTVDPEGDYGDLPSVSEPRAPDVGEASEDLSRGGELDGDAIEES